MKITFSRKSFSDAFATAATCSPRNSPKPVLKNVKIEANGAVTLTATDMEMGISIGVDGVEVESPGAILAPANLLSSILRESTDDTITIESTKNGTVVHGERSEFKLPSSNPDEFPAAVGFTESSYHQTPGRLFRELLKRTIFACDLESSRFALGGVLLEFGEGKITAVATDGRRLSVMEGCASLVEPNSYRAGGMTIVPVRAVSLLQRVFTDDSTVDISMKNNMIVARSGGATVFALLVDGRFPKWQEVLPSRNRGGVTFEVAVGPFYSALRQAAIVASEESRGINFEFSEGSLVMSGATAEIGTSKAELPVPYSGQPVTVTLDHRYITDFFKIFDGEKIVLVDVLDSDSAVVFSTDDGSRYLAMPLARQV